MRTRRLPREEEATLVEHVEELRQRLIVTVATAAVTSAAAFTLPARPGIAGAAA